MRSMSGIDTRHGLVHRRAVIRYTYDDPASPQQKARGLITVNFRGKSEASARSYLIRKYPKLQNVQVTELVFI